MVSDWFKLDLYKNIKIKMLTTIWWILNAKKKLLIEGLKEIKDTTNINLITFENDSTKEYVFISPVCVKTPLKTSWMLKSTLVKK